MKLPLPQALCPSLLALLTLQAPTAVAADFFFSSGVYLPGVTAPQPLLLGDTLQINAGGNKFFNAVSFGNLGGTVSWNADSLFLQNGAQLSNAALWDVRGDLALVNNGGVLSSFTNSGILRKSVGAGSASVGAIAFVNDGIIDVQSGSLDFVGGNASFNAGTQFSGGGLTRILSNATFSGGFSSANLLLQSGSFSGAAAQISGSVGFGGGALTGGWTVGSGQSLLGQAGGNKFLNGAALSNLGNMLWPTGDSLFLQNGSSLDNQALFEFQASAALVNNGGALSSFVNSGTLRAASGQTGTVGSIAFINNGGLLEAQGSLVFGGGNVSFNTGTTFGGAGVNLVSSNASFSGSISSGNLLLQNGNYAGTAVLLTGVTGFSGGAFGGSWELAAGQTLNGLSGGNKFLNGAAWVNKGEWRWNTGDSLFLQNGSLLDNQGLLAFGSSMSLVNNGGALSSLVNSGSVSVAAGQTVTVGSIAWVNNGGSLIADGTLNFAGGNASFNNGTLFGGAGLNLVSSNARFVGDQQSLNLRLSNGSFTGGDGSAGSKAVLMGQAEFSGGLLTGSWELAPAQQLVGMAGGNKFLNAAGLLNKGIFSWQTGDTLFLQNSSLLDNQGLFDVQTSMTLVNNGGGLSTFANSGTLRVAAAQTLTVGSIAFVNHNGGLLTVGAGGLMNFAGGIASFNAGTQMGGAGVVAITSNATFNEAFTASHLSLRNGSFSGAAASLGGQAELAGGFLTGSWTVAPGATLSGVSGGNKFLNAAALSNQGRLVWASGDSLFLQNGSSLVNEGLLELQTDMSFVNNGGALSSLNNKGRLLKSGGAGTAVIPSNIAFSNPGAMEVQAGTIQLPVNFSNPGTMMGTGAFTTNVLTNTGHLAPGSSAGTLTLNGNYLQSGAGSFDVELASSLAFDRFLINGTASLDGSLVLHCIAACALSNGDEFVILDATGNLTGTFASISVDGFGAGFQYDVVYDYNQDLVKLTVLQVGAVPEVPSWAMLLGGVGLLALRRRTRRLKS